ncbi:hypothetical protein H0H93_011592 [Arthromyces matolae]|nr:hypothetical protein H0H93_011592 [Arthromyces matolae]
MWGSSPAFVEMQKSQKPIISKRTIEWESLLRVAVLQQQALGDGASTMTDETQLWLVLTPTKDLDRDGHRKLFVAWLLKDIGKELYSNGEATLAEVSKLTMPWAKWLNFAIAHKLCLINWPTKTQGPDGTVTKYDYRNYAKHEDLRASNERRERKPDHPRATRIIRWGADDLKLNPGDKNYMRVPLLIEYPELVTLGTYAEPVVLARVRDAPKYRFARNFHPGGRDDDDDDDGPEASDEDGTPGVQDGEEDEDEEDEDEVVVVKKKKKSGKRAGSPLNEGRVATSSKKPRKVASLEKRRGVVVEAAKGKSRKQVGDREVEGRSKKGRKQT